MQYNYKLDCQEAARKYAVKPLLVRKWEMGISAYFFCAKYGCITTVMGKGQGEYYWSHLKTAIVEDINKWKDILCSWIQRMYIVKTSIVPKALYRFNKIPMKDTIVLVIEIEKTILKIRMEPQKTPNSLSNIEKEGQS